MSPDRLAIARAAAAQPRHDAGVGPVVSRASLQADLLAAQERAARQAARVQQLEKHLSQLLGEQAWRASGLGAPGDIDALKQRIVHLDQQVVDLRGQLDERGDELAAARAANRELILLAKHHCWRPRQADHHGSVPHVVVAQLSTKRPPARGNQRPAHYLRRP